MEICNVLNEATGEKSVLHAKLLEVFKDQKEADLYYSKVLGSDFKEVFGDWVSKYNGESLVKTGATYDTGEPRLKLFKGTNQHYFELQDGTSFFIDKKGLRGSFSPQDIKDISKYFLYRFVQEGGAKSFNEYNAGADQSKILDSIDRAIADYKIQLEGLTNEKAKVGLTKRIEKVALFRNDFKNELIYQLDSLGQKFLENITDGEGNPIGEVTEENKGGGINITESITVNPKSTATVNTKIFLSQLMSQKIDKEGNYVNRSSGYLKTPMFEDFSEVWETLQPMLADQSTIQSNEGVISSYTRMKKIVDGLQDVKPWAKDLSQKLDILYNDNNNGRYKVYEFVQAFNKNKINYYVTEFNAATSAYTIYNATATNSRESQILDRWGFRFQGKFLEDGKQIHLSTEHSDTINKISENVEDIFLEWKAQLDLAGTDRELINKAYQYATPALFEQLRALGVFGLKDSDINALILLGGGNINEYKTVEDLFKGVRFMINGDITFTNKDGSGVKFSDDDGNSTNPFRTQRMLKMLAQAAAMRELDIAESSILASGGKTYFAYSNPTYISNKISEWKQDSSELDQLAKDPINASSRWIKYLLASEVINNEELRKRKSQERLDKLEAGLASSFTSVGKDDGVDNTNISLGDQLNDNISKLLGAVLKDGVSYFPSIIAADKSRRVEFRGFEFVDSGIHDRTPDGSAHIPPQTIDIFIDYFEDEYNRMANVAQDLKTISKDKKIKHYHTGNTNGLKSQLFPELSFDVIEGPLKNLLYKDGLPIESNGIPGFDDIQRAAVKEAVEKSLRERLAETELKINQLSEQTKLNGKLINHYKNNGGTKGLAGDYLVNGLISSIEYTKMFSGDPAFYKDLPDLIKRVPATYTDGLQLALDSSDDLKFNVAIVQGVEVTSKYIQKIKDSLVDKTIAKAYDKVNTTDAQAWITPRRWRFIKQRLGQWSTQHDSVFSKMESGKSLSDDEMKLAAQPLKGVYFEINKGVPTYLKYSQAVLIPHMVKGTPMARMLKKMTHDSKGNYISNPSDEIHEVITEDGIKVGAIAPSKINEGDTTTLAEDFELNTNTLTNKGWKLQQDLPIKTMHETNIGSQIQKNILEGLGLSDEYKVFGEDKPVSGRLLLQKVHDAVSSLVDIGADEVSKKLGIVGDKITDKSALYEVMIKEFKERGGNENIIAALEKQTPFDAIPQIRGRIDSILMSVFNRAMTKISTEGGSFIQVSPFGFETFGKGVEGESVQRYSNDDLYNNPDKVYAFGDNTDRKGTGGQAQIRNNKNAFGIATKLHPTNDADAFMTDDSFEENKRIISSDISKILATGKKVVFPKDGFGTGLAKLKEKAPKTYEYLKAELSDKFGFDNDTGIFLGKKNESGIINISNNYDGEGLQPPREGPNGQTLPGQVMIPHTLAMKLLRQSNQNLTNMTPAKWKKVFSDPKTRELVGYRIPNQGMSSNDTLEIVGVLPATMGDSIIGYDGIPAKTGSDFDIDKMYVMAPNLMYNKKDEKFELINEENKQFYKGNKNVSKLIAQNNVLNLYSDILQSPHTYDNMMTSIDTAFLKNDIDKLHPKPEAKNLDLFSPITQLQTKKNYMDGKTGVGLTANQLVDHVANQSLKISLSTNIGMGNVLIGKKGLTYMDEPSSGRSIATTLSAFLNAYVDIAKDPYITRGNHNGETANISFMLIRAGATLEQVNRYIGQPILKELVELKQRASSITAVPLTIKNADGTLKAATPYEFLRDKYNIEKFDKSHLKLETITPAQYESRIRGNPNEFVDSVVLNAFEFHEKKAGQWTDAVLAAKVDTKGAGGSPITMNIAINKIDKVNRMGFVNGFESKFKDTALGTYRKQALYFTKKVLNRSGIVLSGTEEASYFMDTVSYKTTKENALVSEKLGKSIDKGMYAYLMSSTNMMKNNRSNFKMLFEKLPLQIAELAKTSENFLIKELELQRRGNYNFIGINAKDKPALYQNNIYRAWMDLYENEGTKELAVNLTRYAYSQSGFSANLNQFFTHIPHEILKNEGINAEVNGFFQRLGDMASDGVFIDQFLRHESDNTDVIPRLNAASYVVHEDVELQHGFVANSFFADKYKIIEGRESHIRPPLFTSLFLGDESALYELINPGDDFENVSPAYVRTYKLGYKAGKNKVFEYSYNNPLKKSILPENQFDSEMLAKIHQAKKDLYIEDEREAGHIEATEPTVEDVENSIEWAGEPGNGVEENGASEETSFALTLDIMQGLGITKKNCE